MSENKTSNRLPLYLQISELLHREIGAGHWVPGERLPTEAQLAKDLDVAVGTLRKALDTLEKDGLLERRQGSGTYVKMPPAGGAIYQFFRLELLNGGGMPNAKTLSVTHMADPFVAKKLGHTDTDRLLWRVRRLRNLNRQPIAAEEIWFDGRHAETLDVADMHESLYMHYRESFNFWVTHVTDEISCQQAPRWASELLDLPEPSVLGWISRQAWANNGKVEEFSQTWFDPAVSRYMARWS